MNSQLYAPAALPPGKPPGTHWIGSWVGPRAGLNAVENRKILSVPRIRHRTTPSIPNKVHKIESWISLVWITTFKIQIPSRSWIFFEVSLWRKTFVPVYSWKVIRFFMHVAWWMRGSEAIIPCRKFWYISPGYNNTASTACFLTCNGYEGGPDINLIHSSLYNVLTRINRDVVNTSTLGNVTWILFFRVLRILLN
jgi:hypothetical protein